MKLEIYGDHGHYSGHGESTDERLMPCPFCGSREIIVTNTHTAAYTAKCDNCGAEGPTPYEEPTRRRERREIVEARHRRVFAQAVNSWNSRARLAGVERPPILPVLED